MQLTIDTANLTFSHSEILQLTRLLENIITNHTAIDEIVSRPARNFPIDEWTICNNVHLHLQQISDGSSRTRRIITAYNIYNKLTPITDTRYFITIKPTTTKQIKLNLTKEPS